MGRSPSYHRNKSARRTRAREAAAERLADLRSINACCGNCRHWRKYRGPEFENQLCCDLETDFAGVAIREYSHLCVRHVYENQP